MRIVTHDTGFVWFAYDAEYDGPPDKVGDGKTERDAVYDLYEKLGEPKNEAVERERVEALAQVLKIPVEQAVWEMPSTAADAALEQHVTRWAQQLGARKPPHRVSLTRDSRKQLTHLQRYSQEASLALYPHPPACPECAALSVCNACGQALTRSGPRCPNGRCAACHGQLCTPGGGAAPDHGPGEATYARGHYKWDDHARS